MSWRFRVFTPHTREDLNNGEIRCFPKQISFPKCREMTHWKRYDLLVTKRLFSSTRNVIFGSCGPFGSKVFNEVGWQQKWLKTHIYNDLKMWDVRIHIASLDKSTLNFGVHLSSLQGSPSPTTDPDFRDFDR